MDVQISATLHAIRNKDPRLYDKNYKFIEIPDEDEVNKGRKEEKPVLLRDYQREKLLRGEADASEDDQDSPPQTYVQQQDELKKSIVSEIKAAQQDDSTDDDSGDEGFMKKKVTASIGQDENSMHPSRAGPIKISELDVNTAEKDPDTYLSNFLAARAWIPEEGGRWKAFESDEGEDDNRADEFEQAYNLRFEDPEKSNEVLKSYARDFAAARSVRREEKTGRKRRRELEKERKEEEKRQLREEKARLRKLKVEDAQEKLHKIKQAAGAAGKELTEAEWVKFLDDAWENDAWEEEMKKRFGEDYYAMEDDAAGSEGTDEDGAGADGLNKKKRRKHPSKPKWDDDIDIKDLVPDFEDEEEVIPDLSVSDSEQNEQDDEGEEEDVPPTKKRKTSDHKRARLDSQRQARQERAKLEALVDSKIQLTNHDLLAPSSSSSSKPNAGTAGFRYRETSPQSFGMTARDILLAPSDKALNEFFGLKKLASFRDPDKKRRDKKRLGKKARLREWRRGTFGREYEKDGPTYGFEALMTDAEGNTLGKDASEKAGEDGGSGHIVGDAGGRKKKRKRSKGSRGKDVTKVIED